MGLAEILLECAKAATAAHNLNLAISEICSVCHQKLPCNFVSRFLKFFLHGLLLQAQDSIHFQPYIMLKHILELWEKIKWTEYTDVHT